jgi:hypothetical protein
MWSMNLYIKISKGSGNEIAFEYLAMEGKDINSTTTNGM